MYPVERHLFSVTGFLHRKKIEAISWEIDVGYFGIVSLCLVNLNFPNVKKDNMK